MLILHRGDCLPTVAVLQSHLNQQTTTDGYLAVDGIFGPKTEGAVRGFHAEHGRKGGGGIVDYATWVGVVGARWQIIDSVDRSDHASKEDRIEDHLDLAPFGQTVLEQFGLSGGAPHVLTVVRGAARGGQVVLLRFHGHGGPGRMLVSSGRISTGSSLDHRYGEGFVNALRTLRPMFARFGSVEMHGCRVALGRPGRTLLARMADALGVPVTAGLNPQRGGGPSTFRFEGPTLTICPNGRQLRSWANESAAISVPQP